MILTDKSGVHIRLLAESY